VLAVSDKIGHRETRTGTKEATLIKRKEVATVSSVCTVAVESPTAAIAAYLNNAMHRSRGSAANFNHSFLAATWVIAADYEVLGLASDLRHYF
jgi:hypothetical protein